MASQNRVEVMATGKKTDIISGLEEYAIVKARELNRYKVENTVNPRYEIGE